MEVQLTYINTPLWLLVSRALMQPTWFWGDVSPLQPRPPLQGPTPTRTRRLTSRLSLRARTARPTRRSTVTWPAPQTRETSRWCSTPSPTSSSPTTCGAAACTERALSSTGPPPDPDPDPDPPPPPPSSYNPQRPHLSFDSRCGKNDDFAEYLKMKKKNTTRYILIMRII